MDNDEVRDVLKKLDSGHESRLNGLLKARAQEGKLLTPEEEQQVGEELITLRRQLFLLSQLSLVRAQVKHARRSLGFSIDGI